MTRRKLPHLEGESVKIFREAVRAEETWLQYERRFWRFLDWLGETPDSFLERSKADKNWATVKVIDYIILQKQSSFEQFCSQFDWYDVKILSSFLTKLDYPLNTTTQSLHSIWQLFRKVFRSQG